MTRRCTRNQEDRLLRLLQRIRSQPGATKAQLAREFATSPRTIQRDLTVLRDIHEAPVAFRADVGGFVLDDPTWRLPIHGPNLTQVIPLLLAREALSILPGTRLAEHLDGFVAKLTSKLPDLERLELRRLAARISFEDEPRRPIRGPVFQSIVTALRQQRALLVEYRSPQDAASRKSQIHPRHLAWIAGEWYLHAVEDGRTRRYAVSRIRHAALDDPTPASLPIDRALEERKRFRRFPPSKDREVVRLKVRFTPAAAPWVLERRWHRQQVTTRKRDGSLLLEFPTPSMFEAFRWVMAWGPEIEVVSPTALRRAVADAAQRMATIHVAPPRRPVPLVERELPDGLFH